MYRNGQDRAEAVSGIGSLPLRPPGNIHIHSHLFMCSGLMDMLKLTHAHTCIHGYLLSHDNTHIHIPAHLNVCTLVLVHWYGYTDTPNICTLPTTHSHAEKPPNGYSQSSPSRGQVRVHSPLHSHTQLTGCSLTLMYIFSWPQQAPVCTCIVTGTPRQKFSQRYLHSSTLIASLKQNLHFRYSAEVKDWFWGKSYCKRLKPWSLHKWRAGPLTPLDARVAESRIFASFWHGITFQCHGSSLPKGKSRRLPASSAAVHKVCPPESDIYRRNQEIGDQNY